MNATLSRPLLALSFSLALACYPALLAQDESSDEHTEKPYSTTETTLTFRPKPELPEYEFVLEGIDEDKFSVEKISVFRITKHKKAFIQTLHGSPDEGGLIDLGKNRVVWDVEDVNFDGFLDVGLRSDVGATGNTLYNYWLFDPGTEKFKFSEDLSQLPNIELDKARQIIASHEMHRFGYDDYKFKKGKLVRVKHVSDSEASKEQ